MLEFSWSGSSKPPRSDAAEAQQRPAPPAVENCGAAECTPAPTSEPSEVGGGPTPAATEAASAETPVVDGGDLPTAFGLARRLGRPRGRRLVKPAAPTP